MNGAAPILTKVLDRVTATTAISLPIYVLGCTTLTFYVQGNDTTSGGTISFEEAAWVPDKDSPFGGTWSDLTGGTAVNASDVSGGKQLAYHVGGPGGSFSYAWVRAKIATTITGGGTITVYCVAV